MKCASYLPNRHPDSDRSNKTVTMKPERPAMSTATDAGSPQQPNDARPFYPGEKDLD